MTTINCSSNCKHQLDGRCYLDNTATNIVSSNDVCIYLEEKPTRKEFERNGQNRI